MSQPHKPNPTAGLVDEEELARMREQLAHWERYVKDQQDNRMEAAALVQAAMDASGLTARGVDPTDPVFAEIALDLEFQKQVSLRYGLKLDQAPPVDTSKPDPSRWRQRTRALKV
jgi:hypothetical protein